MDENGFKTGIVSGFISGVLVLLLGHALDLYEKDPISLTLSVILIIISFIIMLWVVDKFLIKER